MLFTSEKINPQIFKNIIFCTLQKVRGLCPSVLVNQDGNVQNNLLVKNLTVKVLQITVQHIYTQHSRSHWTTTEIMTRTETYGMHRESVMTALNRDLSQIFLPKGLIPIDFCRNSNLISKRARFCFIHVHFGTRINRFIYLMFSMTSESPKLEMKI